MEISARSREIYDRLATGWNTWDVQSVTAHVLLPDRLRLNVAFIIPARNGYSENSLWANVSNFGEHSADGLYTSVDIAYLEGLWRVESTARGRELLLRVKPLADREGSYVALEVGGAFGGRLDIAYTDDGVDARAGDEVCKVRALNGQAPIAWNPSYQHTLVCDGRETCYFTVNSQKSGPEIDRAIEEAEREWLGTTLSAQGALGEGLAAMRRSLLWNMVYESRNGRVVTPVSRNWCTRRGRHFGDYVLFGWDTFFAALQFALLDKDLAYAAFFSILEEITPEGMIPNFGCATGQSRDRSEPQVGALCAWKLYQQFGDEWFIRECFDRLLSWNRWRFDNRDLNGDGLLELASTPYPGSYDELKADGFGSQSKQGAMWESGIDNSTMWDRAVYNAEHCCLELSYVGLNALMVADCELLMKMAELIGRKDAYAELSARRERLAGLINSQLWDEQTGIYLNRHWSGEFDPTLSLTHFYPLIAGIVDEGRLPRLLAHLTDENEFWGKYIIPNIARSDPSYTDQEYWRGRIWAPTNFLVGEGLLRTGQDALFEELAKKGLELFIDCWQKRGVVGENYNAITGEAAENKSSDRFYHWGALLVYMAVECALNFDQWQDSQRANPLPQWLGEIHNLAMGQGKVNVTAKGIESV